MIWKMVKMIYSYIHLIASKNNSSIFINGNAKVFINNAGTILAVNCQVLHSHYLNFSNSEMLTTNIMEYCTYKIKCTSY